MTDPASATPSDPPKPRKGSDLWWLLLALVVAGGIFAAIYFLPMQDRFMPPVAGAAFAQPQIAEIERRVQVLEARVSNLETQMQNMPPAQANTPVAGQISAPHTAPTADIAHLQSDLAQLASTVGTLQSQVKQSDAAARAVTKTALVRIIAFMQLRDAAMSDHGFAAQLDAMRTAAVDDPGLKDPLDKLAPYAAKGAPTTALLREELTEQTSAVEVAAAKAGAQNWWERILAELRGLILIRPLHGGNAQDDTLEAMKTALAQDDAAGALAAMKNLLPEAQQTLADWQKQAEARQAIMESLQAIADRLTADTDTNAAPPAKDTP